MHGLRKDRTRDRGVRPGLLTGLAAGAAALALVACSGPAASASRGAWFQLQAGTFHPVANAGAARPVPRAPWTVQARVADLAFLGEALYCGLNGTGLARIQRAPDGTLGFDYHSDALIFGHRTITALVPRDPALTVHLYFNALLNDVRPQDLILAGISLVSFLPGKDEFAFLVPPFQRANPDWESVGFAAESDVSFDFEWKYTDASQTRFQYTRFHLDTGAEEPEDRQAFLDALGVPAIGGPAVPSTLATFFAACRARMPTQPPGTSLQFSIRSRESPVKRAYRSRRESEAAVQIPVFEERGTLIALMPGGSLLSVEPGHAPVAQGLPRLPGGFRYTDLAKWGSFLVIPWEETSFTDVGRAGLLVYPWPGR